MSLTGLALVLALGLAGPLLATPKRAGIPVAVGEISAGVLAGRTGCGGSTRASRCSPSSPPRASA